MPYKDPEDQKRYMKQHYEANKAKYVERAIVWNRSNRTKVRELVRTAKDNPCTDCGKRYPYYVMQFDHVDAQTKLHNIGDLAWGYTSLSVVQAEIEKCELVCANCHAERTHQRRSGGQI